jgi:hypothetical protein
MILLEAFSVIMLPGGPTEGCHNCPLRVDVIIALLIFNNVWIPNFRFVLSLVVSHRHTSNGTARRQSTGLVLSVHPVWPRSRLNGKPGSSYVDVGGELLLWSNQNDFLATRRINAQWTGRRVADACTEKAPGRRIDKMGHDTASTGGLRILNASKCRGWKGGIKLPGPKWSPEWKK